MYIENIDIFLPSEIFDKIINILGEEYRKNIRKNIRKDMTDSDILKIDDRITFVKDEVLHGSVNTYVIHDTD